MKDCLTEKINILTYHQNYISLAEHMEKIDNKLIDIINDIKKIKQENHNELEENNNIRNKLIDLLEKFNKQNKDELNKESINNDILNKVENDSYILKKMALRIEVLESKIFKSDILNIKEVVLDYLSDYDTILKRKNENVLEIKNKIDILEQKFNSLT